MRYKLKNRTSHDFRGTIYFSDVIVMKVVYLNVLLRLSRPLADSSVVFLGNRTVVATT